MPSKASSRPEADLRPRYRVVRGRHVAIGPGKAELLGHLQETRSIARAARRMGMSYMRAWTLIQTMDRCFKEPLVRAVRGGVRGGGAELTGTGRRVLALYRRLETVSRRATRATWRELRGLLRR